MDDNWSWEREELIVKNKVDWSNTIAHRNFISRLRSKQTTKEEISMLAKKSMMYFDDES